MSEDEWEEFYNALSDRLKRDYPDLHERMFSGGRRTRLEFVASSAAALHERKAIIPISGSIVAFRTRKRGRDRDHGTLSLGTAAVNAKRARPDALGGGRRPPWRRRRCAAAPRHRAVLLVEQECRGGLVTLRRVGAPQTRNSHYGTDYRQF